MIGNFQITEIESKFLNEGYTKIIHKSGLEIYISKKNFTQKFAVFATKYGSFDNVFRFEGEGEYSEVPYGIAHFLEHKMFENADGKDAFELYSQVGADANAYTSTDRTAYLFSCTENFYDALKILLKMVTEPYFTNETVKKEQGIIGEEIKMCSDNPSNALYYGLCKALYHNNPIQIPIAGTIESIAEITPELLYKCHEIFYQMSNMYLVICGEVETEKVLEIVDNIIKVGPQKTIELKSFSESAGISNPCVISYLDVSKPLFRIGIKNNYDIKLEVINVMCELLFNKSGKFYSDLFESGKIISYSYFFNHDRTSSYFSLGGDSDNPREVFDEFVKYTEEVLKNGVNEEDFIRIKRVMYAEVLSSFNSSDNIADNILEGALRNENFLEHAKSIQDVTIQEVMDFAHKLFKPENYAMSIVYPTKMKQSE